MPSTPVMIMAGCVILLAWKTGAVGNLVAKFRGSQIPPPPRPIQSIGVAPPPASNVDALAGQYDSQTLGLAFHMAARREADRDTAQKLADANRTAAVSAYQAPFSAGGGQAPPPPGPLPKV